jgi:hypothetical protein
MNTLLARASEEATLCYAHIMLWNDSYGGRCSAYVHSAAHMLFGNGTL